MHSLPLDNHFTPFSEFEVVKKFECNLSQGLLVCFSLAWQDTRLNKGCLKAFVLFVD